MDACIGGNLTCRPGFDAMRIRNGNRPGGKIAQLFSFMKKSGNFCRQRFGADGARFPYLRATTPATILRIDPAV
jgi:hypothetical protein